MSESIQEIKYTKRDDNVYMFKVPNGISEVQLESVRDMFKDVLPKGSRCLLLPKGYDYILPDNQALMERMDDIQSKLEVKTELIKELKNKVASRDETIAHLKELLSDE